MSHSKIAIPGKVMLKPKKNHKKQDTVDRTLGVLQDSPNQKIVNEVPL